VLQKLPDLGNPTTARDRSSFSFFIDPASFPEPFRWVAFGLNLWDANAIGMFFAVLLGGAASAALVPEVRLQNLLTKRGPLGAGLGGSLGLPLFMCSACSTPVSVGFFRSGASLETSLGIVLGSALFNPVGIFAIFLLMPLEMALARVGFGLIAIFLLVPMIAQGKRALELEHTARRMPLTDSPIKPSGLDSWAAATKDALKAWWTQTLQVSLRLVPAMFLAGFLVGAVLLFAQPQTLSRFGAEGIAIVLVAALVGTLLQLPTLFEIPLVLGVIALGLGLGPATALLLTAPSSGIVTFLLLRRDLGWRIPAMLLGGTFALGSLAGLIVNTV
jgi:uncharacterized membrane protein YraQ (UPF0718 family)